MLIVNGVDSQNKYLNGPDQLVPVDDYITWKPDGRVKLRMSNRGFASEPPISVPGLLSRTVARYPDETALCTKRNGKWEKLTYRQYQEKVRTIAKAFLKLGLERYHSVCILGFNSEEWYISDLAAIHAGGYAAGIYTTNSPEACFHCLESSRANICAVQDKKQLDKILSIRSRLPHLKAIIQWEGQVDTSIPGVYNWKQLMEMGAKEPDTQLDNVLKTIAVNECCTLVYTSGTVSQPKAVMLSHDNLTWDAYSCTLRVDNVQPAIDRIISYLPLSHVAAQVIDIYITLGSAVAVYFAQPDALKGSLLETLKEIRPTKFMGVPRIWEKMYERIVAVGSSRGAMTKYIATWAKNQGSKHHLARINGAFSADMMGLPQDFSIKEMLRYWQEGTTCGYKLAKSLVFDKVKETLGLDRCDLFVTAAAPLSPDIKKFFLSLDIPLMDAFGMSEAAGAHSLSRYPRFKLDSAGELLEGTETTFAGSDSVNGPGEILIRGRHVFMGYLNSEEMTRAAFNKDGWLMTGDVGRVDSQNLLYITGRIKEILITAGGENVAPVLIEQTVQAELPHIGYAVLIGDRRKFLSILLTLKAKVDPNTGDVLDELDNETRKWVAGLGSKATTVSEIVKSKDPLVYKAIEEGITKANKLAISNAQKIQKFALLPVDLSLNSGELGPTLKIKRNVVYEKYKDIIEDFYKD
ncbi:long-chain-fatty-acid--CoA ligase ACSBG2-like isoform X1 [Pieris brassicae]|uniref:long-chain-fatty-acid--CoA ligase ACSBG2-like isoform X1 n=1 Tax=Pieris brassicae TaxID=7116 RepID=UPI001E6611AA|nr:long-chain-fatty-acid--CoA ligase ACSBG2-like isoform X1 [Pieris brassicae]XP_045527962.1 long-chain-fatty-acid--CoA ligase ACSBG2-like isoform X1 [Pieris brassicae]XP_045527963.1 long-chain-fatty-acid--CoA ligase ACSBG2-like isoform X1 [Pieris brassicae]